MTNNRYLGRSGFRHKSSRVQNSRTRLLLNTNILPEPSKNLIIFIIPFNIYNYSSSASHRTTSFFRCVQCTSQQYIQTTTVPRYITWINLVLGRVKERSLPGIVQVRFVRDSMNFVLDVLFVYFTK